VTFWEYLDRRAANSKRMDARGWIGFGVYVLCWAVIALLATVPELRSDEFFKTIATLIIGAFIKDVVGWAYQATKGGGELAERNARVVEDQARGNIPPETQG
jgi:ABC-type branched-subunit amino acid transport system permease subunit